MTDKTLREQLPQGCARNKIEFLADEFEAKAAELAELIAGLGSNSGSAPLPKISATENGDFTGNMATNIMVGTSEVDDVNASALNGRLSLPIGDGWSFEAEKARANYTPAHVFRKRTPDTYYGFMGRNENGVMELHCGKDRAVMYQVLSPRRNTKHPKLKGSVRILEENGMTLRVGIKSAQVDKHGFLRITHPEKRMCETVYTHVGAAYPAKPRVVESPGWHISPYAHNFDVLYIEAEGGYMLNVTDALAWMDGMLGDGDVLLHREPPTVGQFRDMLETKDGENIAGSDDFVYHFKQTHHCPFHPLQHIALLHVGVDNQGVGNHKPTIKEITTDYIKVSYPADVAETMRTTGNRLVYRYGLNPSSLGFYDSHANWLARK
ncbi:hypothetical protein ACFFLZ_06435 [Photobacterium aphoticum]|uniref:Uncharacterized protein n=1 Tax=Photobacterium aphoticum TaxID=754436 RepID=A0A0J1GRD8_9GAMM|nr:hypothetical protein [Photobacterium aphoticum]KLV01999.1 hypothetical protein ABT58_06335 [Photobacterium aphoticum]PSU60245.1 hypothetical protein C9I90_01090 [Photobacterium aphoticum]GHA34324.1 hypothetical protein GCM10007086_04720 [Photobacterium aphoticum]